jgi:hypothetical protein
MDKTLHSAGQGAYAWQADPNWLQNNPSFANAWGNKRNYSAFEGNDQPWGNAVGSNRGTWQGGDRKLLAGANRKLHQVLPNWQGPVSFPANHLHILVAQNLQDAALPYDCLSVTSCESPFTVPSDIWCLSGGPETDYHKLRWHGAAHPTGAVCGRFTNHRRHLPYHLQQHLDRPQPGLCVTSNRRQPDDDAQLVRSWLAFNVSPQF